ncbi:UNVERIFIED_CONTAM: hypothetical protein HDU68_008578 [Siphonaria sp. JEL0065]|nr:hypothetical protein HDU68_008578 [Siphonaria sp. JEL0065]
MKTSLLLALVAASASAIPQWAALPNAVAGAACSSFGAYACSSGSLVQCAYVNSASLTWFQNGNTPCVLAGDQSGAPAPIPAPVPAADANRGSTVVVAQPAAPAPVQPEPAGPLPPSIPQPVVLVAGPAVADVVAVPGTPDQHTADASTNNSNQSSSGSTSNSNGAVPVSNNKSAGNTVIVQAPNPILPVQAPTDNNTSSSAFSKTGIIGGAVGSIVVLAVGFAVVTQRRRRSASAANEKSDSASIISCDNDVGIANMGFGAGNHRDSINTLVEEYHQNDLAALDAQAGFTKGSFYASAPPQLVRLPAPRAVSATVLPTASRPQVSRPQMSWPTSPLPATPVNRSSSVSTASSVESVHTVRRGEVAVQQVHVVDSQVDEVVASYTA